MPRPKFRAAFDDIMDIVKAPRMNGNRPFMIVMQALRLRQIFPRGICLATHVWDLELTRFSGTDLAIFGQVLSRTPKLSITIHYHDFHDNQAMYAFCEMLGQNALLLDTLILRANCRRCRAGCNGDLRWDVTKDRSLPQAILSQRYPLLCHLSLIGGMKPRLSHIQRFACNHPLLHEFLCQDGIIVNDLPDETRKEGEAVPDEEWDCFKGIEETAKRLTGLEHLVFENVGIVEDGFV